MSYRRFSLATLAIGSAAVSVTMGIMPSAQAAPSTPAGQGTAATQFSSPVTVYEAYNPDTNATFLSTSDKEVRSAASYGYTRYIGATFVASSAAGTGLVPVHRLYNATYGFVYMPEGSEMNAAISTYGYKDQKIEFYAPKTAGAGLSPVYRLATPKHNFVFTMDSTTVASDKTKTGWSEGFTAFYAQPASNSNIIWASAQGTGSGDNAASPTSVDNAQKLAEQRLVGATADVKVVYEDGLYRRTNPINLTRADSGTNGHNMVWMNAPAASVTFDGSQKVTGWSPWSGKAGVYRAKTDVALGNSTSSIYVNGVRASLTQAKASDVLGTITTDGTQYDLQTQKAGHFTGYNVTKDISAWPDLQHTSLRWYGNRDNNTAGITWEGWVDRRVPIKSATSTFITPGDDFVNGSPGTAQGVKYPNYIENNIMLLGTPGQFYIDQKGGYIYYTPKAGEDMSSADVEVPVSEGLVTGSINNFEVDGLNFQRDKWSTPLNNGFMDGQNMSEGGNNPPGMVDLDDSNGVVFDRDGFYQSAATSLRVHDRSNTVTVSNGAVYQAGGSAIGLANQDSHTSATGMNIIGETIDTTGTAFPSAAGVFVGNTGNSTFSHNHVRNTTYSGLSFGMGWQDTANVLTNNHIDNNEFDNTMDDYNLFDGGAIYVNGVTDPSHRSTISNNWIDGMGNDADEADPNFRSWSGDVSMSALYLDGSSSNWDVTNNVVQNIHGGTWLGLQTVGGQVAVGNKVTGNWSDYSKANSGDPKDNVVNNNTIFPVGQVPAAAATVKNGI